MDETIVHAYGVVAANELLSQFPPGIADTPVWVHDVENLGAIVGLLPVDGFGVADWERNATNVSWLGQVAQRHHEVLQYAATSRDVVPLRLPSLYGSLESLTETLRAIGDGLEQALRRIQGKLEWSVKVYRSAKEEDRPASAAAVSGREYLLGRSRDLSARSSAREQLAEQVRQIHEALGQASAESVQNRPQDPALSGRREQMLLNGAYLVSRNDEYQFQELAADIADGSLAKGLLLEVTGPWPAYNFTGDADVHARQVIG
jgi:Gas vesicle synthesis protein GvpL/GvpF